MRHTWPYGTAPPKILRPFMAGGEYLTASMLPSNMINVCSESVTAATAATAGAVRAFLAAGCWEKAAAVRHKTATAHVKPDFNIVSSPSTNRSEERRGGQE